MSLDARVMPLGKHKGARVDTVAADDPGYLRWLLMEVDEGRKSMWGWPGLYTHIREALRLRGGLNQ